MKNWSRSEQVARVQPSQMWSRGSFFFFAEQVSSELSGPVDPEKYWLEIGQWRLSQWKHELTERERAVKRKPADLEAVLEFKYKPTFHYAPGLHAITSNAKQNFADRTRLVFARTPPPPPLLPQRTKVRTQGSSLWVGIQKTIWSLRSEFRTILLSRWRNFVRFIRASGNFAMPRQGNLQHIERKRPFPAPTNWNVPGTLATVYVHDFAVWFDLIYWILQKGRNLIQSWQSIIIASFLQAYIA